MMLKTCINKARTETYKHLVSNSRHMTVRLLAQLIYLITQAYKYVKTNRKNHYQPRHCDKEK